MDSTTYAKCRGTETTDMFYVTSTVYQCIDNAV